MNQGIDPLEVLSAALPLWHILGHTGEPLVFKCQGEADVGVDERQCGVAAWPWDIS